MNISRAAVFLLFSLQLMASPRLAPVPIDSSQITVSGLSSGAAMAVQLQVIFSSWIHGVGSIAGTVYGCAEGNLSRAKKVCMSDPEKIDLYKYVKLIREQSAEGLIDSSALLPFTKVFIAQGTKDKIVAPAAGKKLKELFLKFVRPERIQTQLSLIMGHGFPTLHYGNPCDGTQAPWLNECKYDGAGAMLQHLYDGLESSEKFDVSHLKKFDQLEFGAAAAQMDKDGHVFIPASCTLDQPCKLHIALHGCLQSPTQVGDQFVMHAGYNEWADANGIVILYPALAGTAGDSTSCWDWWGYTGSDYLTRNAKQAQVIKKIVDRLQGI